MGLENPANDNTTGTPNVRREPIPLNVQLLSCRDVVAATRVSRATIYRLMAAGDFPKAVKVAGATRWTKPAVEAWLAKLVAENAA